MYMEDFELPAEIERLEGHNALEKIATFYRSFDTFDEISVGVYKY